MKRNIITPLVIIAVLGVIVWFGLTKPPNPFYVGPIYAAPAAKQQESGCTKFATMGMMDIFRCYDDTNGKIFYLNNMGFMVYVGD